MPYQGRRKVVQGSMRLIAISLTILLVSVAAYFQFKTFRMRGYNRSLRKQLIAEQKAIGLNPKSGESFGSRYSTLTRAIQAAKRMQDGTGDDKSVPAKLTFFF
ncbi:MAG: hypothetical protein ACYSSK_09755, partial [Planctomycetota bacterium]